LKLEPVVLTLAKDFPHSALTLIDSVPNIEQLLLSVHYRKLLMTYSEDGK